MRPPLFILLMLVSFISSAQVVYKYTGTFDFSDVGAYSYVTQQVEGAFDGRGSTNAWYHSLTDRISRIFTKTHSVASFENCEGCNEVDQFPVDSAFCFGSWGFDIVFKTRINGPFYADMRYSTPLEPGYTCDNLEYSRFASVTWTFKTFEGDVVAEYVVPESADNCWDTHSFDICIEDVFRIEVRGTDLVRGADSRVAVFDMDHLVINFQNRLDHLPDYTCPPDLTLNFQDLTNLPDYPDLPAHDEWINTIDINHLERVFFFGDCQNSCVQNITLVGSQTEISGNLYEYRQGPVHGTAVHSGIEEDFDETYRIVYRTDDRRLSFTTDLTDVELRLTGWDTYLFEQRLKDLQFKPDRTPPLNQYELVVLDVDQDGDVDWTDHELLLRVVQDDVHPYFGAFRDSTSFVDKRIPVTYEYFEVDAFRDGNLLSEVETKDFEIVDWVALKIGDYSALKYLVPRSSPRSMETLPNIEGMRIDAVYTRAGQQVSVTTLRRALPGELFIVISNGQAYYYLAKN